MSTLHGETVYRIHWRPGTDVLHGTCHCGAEQSAEDPVALWDWLLGHPEGHRQPDWEEVTQDQLVAA